MKVLFLTNVPSPYRVDFFNELGLCCDLTVLFEKQTSDERDESWEKYEFNSFKGIFLEGISISVDSAFCLDVVNYLKDRSFTHIICSTFTSPTGMLAIQYMKRHKISYFLECDGGFAKSGKGIKEKIKKIFISGAKGYFSTGRSCDLYYMKYGARENNIYRYPFSSLKNMDIIDKPINEIEKQSIRENLKIAESFIILTVGQFIYRKGFDILLNIAGQLSKNVGVYFVGGEPTEEYLKIKKEKKLDNVHFIGFKEKAELKKYFQAADIFILPTREDIWGLVVQEAMGNGLPVISTDRCGAALELIQEGENGFLFSIDDVDKLIADINYMIENKSKIKVWGEKNLKIIRNYTIEKMVQKHIEILNR